MIDHLLGRPSPSWRRTQVIGLILALLAFLRHGPTHGPTARVSRWSQILQRFTPWQLIATTCTAVYAFRHMDIILGLESPEPLAQLYSRAYYRATWINTALDAGFSTAYHIRPFFLRDILSVLFSLYYILFASDADEKLRRYRAVCTVELLRTTWEKTTNPYIRLFTILDRPRLRIKRKLMLKRPKGSKYEREMTVWLYFDGTREELRHWKGEVVMDCPGGGFISMSPRHHEERLLAWARKTKRPVVAIDYGKAPEYPYPFAIYECLDLYKLLHLSKGAVIGIETKVPLRIVVSGDSAGANLAAAMTIKLLEKDLFPPPIALIFAYPALDFNFTSFMTPDHLRILRNLSGPGNQLASGIRAQKDHMAHRSPLSVVDDQALMMTLANGSAQPEQEGPGADEGQEEVVKEQEQGGGWSGSARRSWKRSFSRLPMWMREKEQHRRERVQKANEDLGIGLGQPPAGPLPGGGGGGRRSSLKPNQANAIAQMITAEGRNGEVVDSPSAVGGASKQLGLPEVVVNSPAAQTPEAATVSALSGPGREASPRTSPKIGKRDLSRDGQRKTSGERPRRMEQRSLSERVLYHPAEDEDSEDTEKDEKKTISGAASTLSIPAAAGGTGAAKEVGIGTRLTMTSRTGYFNDRIISPTMMRCMAICYVGPRSSPDLSKNYYISPILAPEPILARFPPLFVVCGSQDPFVDDTILFAARVRDAKHNAREARRHARTARAASAASSVASVHRHGGRMGMTRADDARRADLGNGYGSGPGESELDDEVEEDADGDVATKIIDGWSHGFLQMAALLPGVKQTFDLMAEEIGAAFERQRTVDVARKEREKRREREKQRDREREKENERRSRHLSDGSDSEGDVLSFTPRRSVHKDSIPSSARPAIPAAFGHNIARPSSPARSPGSPRSSGGPSRPPGSPKSSRRPHSERRNSLPPAPPSESATETSPKSANVEHNNLHAFPAHAGRVSQLLSEQSAVSRGRPAASLSAPGSSMPSRSGSSSRVNGVAEASGMVRTNSSGAGPPPAAAGGAPFVEAADLLLRRQQQGVYGTETPAEDAKSKPKTNGIGNNGSNGVNGKSSGSQGKANGKKSSREVDDEDPEEKLIREVPQNYGL